MAGARAQADADGGGAGERAGLPSGRRGDESVPDDIAASWTGRGFHRGAGRHSRKDADVLLSCAVSFPQGVLQIPPRQVFVDTHTRLSEKSFEAVSNPGLQPDDLRIKAGLVDLSAEQFDLLQMDVDGAGLKVMNFARSLSRLKPEGQRIDPATRFEKELGAPALRTAGLMLVQRKRAELLTRRLLANKDNNTRAEQGFQGARTAPTCGRKIVVRGYRIDIWDRKTQVWRSLCERQALYDIGAGTITIGAWGRRGHRSTRRDQVIRQDQQSRSAVSPRGAALLDRLELDGSAAGPRHHAGRQGRQIVGDDAKPRFPRACTSRRSSNRHSGRCRACATDATTGFGRVRSTSPATRWRRRSRASVRKP